MSNAISAHGTLIARNGTTIGELRDITMPPLSRNTFDTTNQNDADDSYVVGIRRKGELGFSINFLPSGDATHGTASGLMKSFQDGSKDGWRVTFPDTTTWAMSGFITNIAVKAPVDGELGADISVRPTGITTFTP